MGIRDWGRGRDRDRDRGHLALTLASPLGEEGHAVAKGCSTVRGVSDHDWDRYQGSSAGRRHPERQRRISVRVVNDRNANKYRSAGRLGAPDGAIGIGAEIGDREAPPSTIILSECEGSRFMPIVSHLLINTSRWGGW